MGRGPGMQGGVKEKKLSKLGTRFVQAFYTSHYVNVHMHIPLIILPEALMLTLLNMI